MSDNKKDDGSAPVALTGLEFIPLGAAVLGGSGVKVVEAIMKKPELAFEIDPVEIKGGDGVTEPSIWRVRFRSLLVARCYLMKIVVRDKAVRSRIYKAGQSVGWGGADDSRPATLPLPLSRSDPTFLDIELQAEKGPPQTAFRVTYEILPLNHKKPIQVEGILSIPENF